MTTFILICSIFLPHPGKNQILHPQEELTRLIPHSPGTENSKMPWVPSGGVLEFRFAWRITSRTNQIA